MKKYFVESTCVDCAVVFEHSKYQINRVRCALCAKAYNQRTLRERNKVSLKERWKNRYGDAWVERYDAWLQKMSTVTSGVHNPMYGRHDHVHGLRRHAKENTGKTLDEIHGVDAANDIRQRMSFALSGEKNPAFGKAYTNGGKSVKGYYKGKFFRSLLEYSFMKHLEHEGLSLEYDVDYESLLIPYDLAGVKRTYRIDFYDRSRRIAYEVKPAYALKKMSLMNEEKWKAAREHLLAQNIQFKVVSELDFRKIAFDVARQDVDVAWKTETFKYFKETR